ncbi:GNAT family N-acetyltransferase [Rubripirellula reticaptiva]|uniref:Acetyltransferase (GNAT) family protein n=1 Tax=Rubripirellula reticaptiva TaxID=2528013 RepID=A0A5C6EFE5_9BACT|nr:GNAT family N-acetyltransferase [Rubripirellula reticaptiva]TWU46411.1 Acetyltransferase (GNAT) family protein [Rubripirellula reticaptiva]
MTLFLKKIKQQGIFHLIETRFNQWVPAWVFRFSVGDVLEMDLAKLAAQWNQNKSDDFIASVVQSPDDRDRLRKFTWNSVPVETTHDDLGYAITSAATPKTTIGGVWVGTHDFLESNLGFQIKLTECQAWLYCAYVDPATRGLGIYQRVLSFAADDVQSKGFERLLVVIQPWNRSSMRVHQKFTRQRVGRIMVIRVMRWSFVFCNGSVTKDKTIVKHVADLQTQSASHLRIV